LKTLVLGLGNVLMNDDAAGVLVARNLEKKYPETETLKIMDGGTLGLDLVTHLAGIEKLIIIDAVNVGLEPGTVVKIEGNDIDSVFENKLSPHQMGLKDILFAADLIDCKPNEIVLFGIQYQSIQFDQTLSEPVKKNLNKLEKEVEKEILKEK
jgi:hydrogenase maturation protease